METPEETCIRQARELAAAQARIASLEDANRLLEQKLDHLRLSFNA